MKLEKDTTHYSRVYWASFEVRAFLQIVPTSQSDCLEAIRLMAVLSDLLAEGVIDKPEMPDWITKRQAD